MSRSVGESAWSSPSADQLRSFFRLAEDAAEAEALKAELSRIGRDGTGHLTASQFWRVARWKLGGQWGRTERLLERIHEPDIEIVTAAAFNVRGSSLDARTELRVGLLMSLPGVGLGIASAILAMALPADHAVIDFRGWRALYGEEQRSFSTRDYCKYLRDLRPLASELGWSVQDVDLALWEWDRRRAAG